MCNLFFFFFWSFFLSSRQIFFLPSPIFGAILHAIRDVLYRTCTDSSGALRTGRPPPHATASSVPNRHRVSTTRRHVKGSGSVSRRFPVQRTRGAAADVAGRDPSFFETSFNTRTQLWKSKTTPRHYFRVTDRRRPAVRIVYYCFRAQAAGNFFWNSLHLVAAVRNVTNGRRRRRGTGFLDPIESEKISKNAWNDWDDSKTSLRVKCIQTLCLKIWRLTTWKFLRNHVLPSSWRSNSSSVLVCL